jgi:glycosyltransferase involved in cell wall biosynthesis
VFSDWYVPGYKAGGPIKSVKDMIQLLADYFQIHVITRNTDWMDSIPYEMESDKWVDQQGVKVMYLSGSYLSFNLNLVKKLSPDDVVFFNGIYSPFFNSFPIIRLLLKTRRAKTIISARGMLNPNALALKPFRKKVILRLMKFLGVERKCVFHAASELEEKSILNVFKNAHIKMASNIPAIPKHERLKMDGYNLKRFLSVGRISPVKNSSFLVDLFEANGNCTVDLIGSSDDGEYLEICKTIADNSDKRVNLLGARNPMELDRIWNNYGYFISPTSGENFGHAIIESLSNGVPVIISDRTPWNDVEELGAGWVISLNNKERWGEVINHASNLGMTDYDRMRIKAIEYVKYKFDLSQIQEQYLNLFRD